MNAVPRTARSTAARDANHRAWSEFIGAVRAVEAARFTHNSIGVAVQLRTHSAFLLRRAVTEAARASVAPTDDSREVRHLAVLERAALSGHGAMRLVRWPARLGARVDLAGDLTAVERHELDADARARIARDAELWEITISGLWMAGSYGFSL